MVLDIVKQAVKTKIVCKNESLLISEAEYVYACVYALKEFGKPEKQIQILKDSETIEGLREQIVPFFETKLDENKDNPSMHRLLRLMVYSKVEGNITEEIRELMDEI